MMYKKGLLIFGLSMLMVSTTFAESLKLEENFKITSNENVLAVDSKIYSRSDQLFIPSDIINNVLGVSKIDYCQYTIGSVRYTEVVELSNIIDLGVDITDDNVIDLNYEKDTKIGKINTITTSNDKDNSISLNIIDKTLNYIIADSTGVNDYAIVISDTHGNEVLKAYFKVNNTNSKLINRVSNSIPVANLDDGKYTIRFFMKNNQNDKSYSTYMNLRSIDIIDGSTSYTLGDVYNSNNYNASKNSVLIEDDYLDMIADEAIGTEILDIALEVTLNIDNDYEKAKELYKWVTTNMAYDYDKLNSSKRSAVKPSETLSTLTGVCSDYSILYTELLKSVGIPCKIVSGYALGTDEIDFSNVDMLNLNHAWVELFVDGKWIVADPTWGSQNSIKDGVRETRDTKSLQYFNPTLEYLSLTHNVVTEYRLPDWS